MFTDLLTILLFLTVIFAITVYPVDEILDDWRDFRKGWK